MAHATNSTKTDVQASLDSNFLIYVEDMSSDPRHLAAQTLLAAIPVERVNISVQALGETLNWLVRKAKVPKPRAADRVLEWTINYDVQSTTLTCLNAARDLIAHHDFPIWDAVILAAAAEAGSNILISEDMQHGFQWQGVTIVNPFLTPPHPLIDSLIAK